MIARILAALRRKPWPASWCRVVAMHMIHAERGTGYRRTIERTDP